MVNHTAAAAASQSVFLPKENFTEELLNLHEAEVRKLRNCFEDHKELFEGVAKWQANWTLYLELDVSVKLSGEAVLSTC